MSRAWKEYLQDLEKRILKMYSEKTIFTEYFNPRSTYPGPEVHICGKARCYQQTPKIWYVWIPDGDFLPTIHDTVSSLDEAIKWIVEHSED